MLRASLAARITMIVVVALTAGWIAMIALYYRSNDWEGEGSRPSPSQIAALVELMERTPREQQPLTLAAVTSSILHARLEVGATPVEAVRGDEAVRQTYAEKLGDRTFSIAAPPISTSQRRFPRLFATVTGSLEFRIALKSGETLVIETKSPLAITRFGLPWASAQVCSGH